MSQLQKPAVNEDTEALVKRLSATRTIMSGTFWNLIGRAGPIWIALIVTPFLVRDLGVSRWGVFTIALSLVGIFGIFDFGIGRSLTRSVGGLIAAGNDKAAASLVMTGLAALAFCGVIGGLFAAFGARIWVEHGLHIAAGQKREVLYSFYVLAASAPFVILTAALWGVLAVYQKFRAANLIGVPLQACYYVGPLLILQRWDSLVGVMLVLLLCRVVSCCLYWRLCVRIMPSLTSARIDVRALFPVLKMGGWMTVSNIMFPVLMYSDRFVIASVLTASATSYYTTPFDVVSRLTIVPIAIMSSAYPAMAVCFRNDPAHTVRLLRRSMLVICTALLPVCLVGASFNVELMSVWIGADFAHHAAPLLRWLVVGILIASVDGVGAGLIDAIGRPDLNAKLSLFELAVSIPLLLVLISWLGLPGAALTWMIRCCVDCGARWILLVHCYKPARQGLLRALPASLIAVGIVVAAPSSGSLAQRIGLDLAAFAFYLLIVARFSISVEERTGMMTALPLAWARLGFKASRVSG